MTTEKEFWNLAGQYFRNELGISEDEHPIDEDCIGCAGPCKVVDVAAKLQKELDEYKEAIQLERIDHATALKTVNQYHHAKIKEHKATIEDLKDRNIEDLHELYDLYEAELRGIKADRTSIKSDRDIMFQNYQNTVAKLQEDIRGLEVELSVCKEDSEVLMEVVDAIKDDTIPNSKVPCVIFNLVDAYIDAPEGPPEVNTTMFEVEYPVDGSRTIHLQKMRIAEQKQTIEKLKSDSDVLMKVVKAIGVWHCCMIPTSLTGCTDLIKVLDDIVEDYADGSPKTPIDDLYKVTVTYAFLEMP